MIYTVQSGDSLWRIAQAQGVSVEEIRRANNLTSNALSLGQRLLIPGKASSSDTAAVASPSASVATSSTSYTVQSGDSLWKISRDQGVSVEEIRRANNLTSNALSLGQQLIIPRSEGRVTVVRPTVERPVVRPTPPAAVDIELPGGQTYSSVSRPSDHALRSILAHQRATLHVASSSGMHVLGSGLLGSVGSGGQNNPRDMGNVYEALKVWGLVGAVVSPAAVSVGIGKFQQRYDTSWWSRAVGRGSGRPMLASSSYRSNLVAPEDATFLMLRDQATYTIQFKDYRNQVQKVSLRNFVKSSFAENPLGVSYAGTQVFPIPKSYFESIGMRGSMAEVLAFVSANEGNFDAINSWDRALFSFGFVQFAGGGRSLHTLLALIKYRHPFLFNDCFGRFGIDVEYNFRNNRFSNQRIVVIDAQAGGRMYYGDDAERHIGENKLLTAAFIRAGYDPEIAKLQVLLAAYEYANPALSRQINVSLSGGTVIRAATSLFICSPAGITALVDMSVNQGVGGASRLFADALSVVAQRQGIRTEDQLRAVDERAVLMQIIEANTRDARITSRVGKALQHLSTGKD
ncbi:MAG: LysM peptidoglycan-binding domain-containing protein [Bernardetiaceae bacterium]